MRYTLHQNLQMLKSYYYKQGNTPVDNLLQEKDLLEV